VIETKYAGWIYFNVEEPRKFLLKHGYVYTMRKKGRKEGWGYAKHGRKFLGKVIIERVADGIEAEKYWKKSGFSSLRDWVRHIDPKKMDIYRVSLVEKILEKPLKSSRCYIRMG